MMTFKNSNIDIVINKNLCRFINHFSLRFTYNKYSEYVHIGMPIKKIMAKLIPQPIRTRFIICRMLQIHNPLNLETGYKVKFWLWTILIKTMCQKSDQRWRGYRIWPRSNRSIILHAAWFVAKLSWKWWFLSAHKYFCMIAL